MSVCVCMWKTPSYSRTTYCVSPTNRCNPTVWNNRPATSETENSMMHASINNCFFSPALTCSPLWRSRHIWKVWISFDHGGLDQPMLGPSSQSSWHSLRCSNSYDESKSHFSCSMSNWNETEKVHSNFTSWNPKCLQYNWKKLDGGQHSWEKIR